MVQLLGPRKFQDQLAYKQLPVLPLPMPSLDSLLKDTSVSPQDRELIAANLLAAELTLKEHMRDLSNKLGLFMDTVSGGVNQKTQRCLVLLMIFLYKRLLIFS